jgi:hypothetical protein
VRVDSLTCRIRSTVIVGTSVSREVGWPLLTT